MYRLRCHSLGLHVDSFTMHVRLFVLCNVVLFQSRSCYPINKSGVEIPDRSEAVPVLVAQFTKNSGNVSTRLIIA